MHFGFKRIEGDIQILLMSSFTLGAPSIKIADKRLSKMTLLVLLNTWATKPPTSICFQARPFCRPPQQHLHHLPWPCHQELHPGVIASAPRDAEMETPFRSRRNTETLVFHQFHQLNAKNFAAFTGQDTSEGWNSKIKVQLPTSRIPEVLKGTLSKPKQKPELSTFSRTVQAIDDPCPYHGFTILFLGSPASLSAAGTFSISWWRVWLSRRRAYHLNLKKLMIFLGYFRVLCYFYWYFMFGLDFASFFF